MKRLKQGSFSNARLTLFNKLQSIDDNILSKDNSNISKVLLFCDDSFNGVKSTLTPSIEYILSTKRFGVSLYLNWHLSICLYEIYCSFCQKIAYIIM